MESRGSSVRSEGAQDVIRGRVEGERKESIGRVGE